MGKTVPAMASDGSDFIPVWAGWGIAPVDRNRVAFESSRKKWAEAQSPGCTLGQHIHTILCTLEPYRQQPENQAG